MCEEFDYDDCPDGFGDSFEAMWAEEEIRANMQAVSEEIETRLGMIRNRICPKCYGAMQPTYEPYELRCEKCGYWWDTYTGKEIDPFSF